MINAEHNPSFAFLISKGAPVHSDPACRSLKQHRTIKRTWRQRLFTRPWRPMWKSYQEGVPTAYVIEIDSIWPDRKTKTTIVAHPEIIAEWKRVNDEHQILEDRHQCKSP